MNTAQQLAIDHWNRTPLFVNEADRYGFYPWLYEAAEFTLHAGHRVLEIGCGTGCDLLQFARNGASAVGIDVTSNHLRLAQIRAGGGAKVCYGSGCDIPFPDSSFDYVYSMGVIHHIDQPRRVVEEVFRVLRPGGKFNVFVYAKWSYVPPILFLRHGLGWRNWIENSRDPVHIDLYTGKQLRKLFAPAQISIRRYGCCYWEPIAPVVGWFLRATGYRPEENDR
jgi:SAM-dependent methyltransferase